LFYFLFFFWRINIEKNKPQVFVQFQSSPESILKTRHKDSKNNRSREPIQFYNDLNLEQLDRHGATLEIARCPTSKSSRSSLPDLTNKISRKNHSEEILIDNDKPKIDVKKCDSNDIMYPISRPKSVVYSTSTQFPRSRSLNGSTRFTKQHHVRFVDEHDDNEKEKTNKRLSINSHRTKSTYYSSASSSSSSSDSDNDEDLDSIYRQYDIHGNRIRRPMNYGTKISYVDECGLGRNTINPMLMKKPITTEKTQKKSSSKRKKKDCIIS